MCLFSLLQAPHPILYSSRQFTTTMSAPSAKEIKLQLSLFDMQVRLAIENGTIYAYMAAHTAKIMSALRFFFLGPNKANQPAESLLQVLQECPRRSLRGI